jgi:hypothetical protein
LRPVLASFYAEGWYERNPWAERSYLQGRLSFFDETEIFAPGEMEAIPLYRDFIRPHGYGWSAGTLVKIPAGGQVGIRFERFLRDGPIEADLKARLNHLRPQLARASLLFTRLGMRQAQSAVAALQMIDVPAAVLTIKGTIIACNTAMDFHLPQVNIGAGDRLAFSNEKAQAALRENLARIMAGEYDRIRGPIAIPATEEHEAALAYLIPMHGMAQDVFGHGTNILMIRPVQSESRLLDLVRMRFAIDSRDALRMTRLLIPANPRLAATLLLSAANLEVTLERFLGHAPAMREAKLVTFLSRLRTAPETSTAP